MSLVSPLPLAFWLSISSALVEWSSPNTPVPQNIAVFLAGFVATGIAWSLLIAGLIAWGQRFITPLFVRLVNLICGLALAFFALKLVWITVLLLRG